MINTENLPNIINIIAAKIKNDNFSCYLTGSYANHYSIESSDIDLTVIYNENMNALDLKRLFEYHIPEIDLTLLANNQITNQNDPSSYDVYREGVLSAKLAGKLIFGKDLLKDLPVPTLDDYIKLTSRMPLYFSGKVRNTVLQSEIKHLSYPDEKDEYKGYLYSAKGISNLSTKLLISTYTWIATSALALRYGKFACNKRQSIDLFKKHDPEKGRYLDYVFTTCRNLWYYRIPTSHKDKLLLQSFCRNLLDWENTYISELNSYYANS